MHRRGVRGARFSRMRVVSNQGSIDLDHLEPLAPRLAQLGWHAQVQTWCDNLVASASRLTALGIPIVVDHMGMVDVGRGVSDPTFRALVRWLEGGKIWIKLSGAYRLSGRYPDYEDMRPFHEILVAANPERLLWGSDWPHVHMKRDMPEDGHLVDLLYRWTDNEDLTRRILVDNPKALYGF
jgi:predicted TIM-barrel fold metal-dependent hydrolase